MIADSDQATFSSILDELYRSVTESMDWRPFLEALCLWLGATGGRLVSPITHEVPVLVGNVPLLTFGANVLDSGFRGVPILEAGFGEPQRLIYLSLFRNDPQRGFGDLERSRFDLISAHFRRALLLRRSLEQAEFSVSASHAALEQIGIGLALITSAAEIKHANAVFRSMADAQDGFRIADGYFVATDAANQTEMIAFLGQTYDRQRDRLTLQIGRRSGTPHQATFRLFKDKSASIRLPVDEAPTALVTISNVAEIRRPEPAAVAAKFKLTVSEARLVSALVTGSDLPSYATESGISIHTARTHLKNIFAKLGTTSQAGLIRLVLAPPQTIERNQTD